MGERDGFAPGTFCWVDLSTSDQEDAKRFYSALLGWEAEDLPMDDGATYSMQRRDGKLVAAIAPQPPQQRIAGVPPLWNSYVWVQSAEDSAARAAKLGGTVHAGPFDVRGAGRMAVLQDPQGAFLMLWEAGEHRGAQLVNAPGALVWNELSTSDSEGACAFYGDLFGWEFDAPLEGSHEPYLVIRNGGSGNGGIRGLQGSAPPNWLAYFGVEDLDAARVQVAELGGGELAGPIDIGIARMAVVRDPQGAVFALYAGTLEP